MTILTNDRVRSLTKSILQGRAAMEGGQGSYLQGLIETTQRELGAEPRKRAGRAVKLSDTDVKAQLAALTKVHERCYAIVLEECEAEVPKGTPDRAKVINSKSNWARTMMYAARSWIRAGNSVTALAATRVTKHSLRVEAERTTPPNPQKLNRRVERGITELIDTVTGLAAIDKPAAIQQLEAALAKITTTLAAIGNHNTTRDPAKAMAEGIPLKTRTGVFYPAVATGAGLGAAS